MSAMFAAIVTGAAVVLPAHAQPAGGLHVITLAGNPAGVPFNTASDGLGAGARFSLPYGIAVTNTGDFFITDSYNYRVCRVTPGGEVTTVAGYLAPPSASTGSGVFSHPSGIAVDDSTGELYVADSFRSTILRISPAGVVTPLAGLAGASGSTDGIGAAARFHFPRGVAVHGAYVYVADEMNQTIRRIERDTGSVITFAGTAGVRGSVDGTGTAARFAGPYGIAIDPSGTGSLVVTDAGNHAIRRISFAGVVTTIAGYPGVAGSADGTGAAARFSQPAGIAANREGNLYVADTFNQTVRKITPGAVVTTLAGTPGARGLVDGAATTARFSGPHGIGVDAWSRIYVIDTTNAVVRVIVSSAPPVITGTLPDLTVDRSATVELGNVPYTTSVHPTFQWFKDGEPIAGATNPTLRLESAQALDSGTYFVRLTNPFGTATSNAFALTVRAPPVVTSLSAPVTLVGDASTVLQVTAIGTAPVTYQWFRGGVALPGEIRNSLTTGIPGAYSVEITNAYGSMASVVVPVQPAKRLVNLATRGSVRGDVDTLIAGFVVTADEGRPKQFLIRGVGPALAGFGVNDHLAQPRLTLYRGTLPIAANTGWSTGSDALQLSAVAQSVGAFALAGGSTDSAMLVTLPPGNYTLELAGANGTSGAALLEIYEVAAELNRLVNLSTRAVVSATEDLFAGVVVGGSNPAKLLVRAVGPGLTVFDIADAMRRPQLHVFAAETVVASNAGWSSAPAPTEIAEAAARTGAFPLAEGSADSALLLTVTPGAYTARVTGLDGGGMVLVEVYEVP
jgi:hypothetical protein